MALEFTKLTLGDAVKTIGSRCFKKLDTASPIPDTPETGEISDSWEEIISYCNDGTYPKRYQVGAYKPLDLGSEGTVNMQIAGFDKDTLANGSGTAAITWISKELLTTIKRMNPSLEGSSGDYTEGTGAIGGWEKCEMRTYLKTTIKPLIPETLGNGIREVIKTQPAYNSAGSIFTQITTDNVWLPSYDEMFGSSSLYYPLFEDTNANRIKYKAGTTRTYSWWLRSAVSDDVFYGVFSDGSTNYVSPNYTSGVVLGFCT